MAKIKKIGYLGAEQYAMFWAEAEQKIYFQHNINSACWLFAQIIA